MDSLNENREQVTEPKQETISETATEETKAAPEAEVSEKAEEKNEGKAEEKAEEKPEEPEAASEAEASEKTEEKAEGKPEEPEAAPEAEVSEKAEETGDTPATEEKTSDAYAPSLMDRIKIGIVVVGGIFVLIAVVYIVAVLGGKDVEIDKMVDTEPVEAVEETVAEVNTEAEQTVVDNTDAAQVQSILVEITGHEKYEQVVYADGGVMIVKSADKYGAISYEGKELVPAKYTSVFEYPNAEGSFVLSNSKSSLAKDDNKETKEEATASKQSEETTYSAFDKTGKNIYEGKKPVIISGNTYILAIEDEKDKKQNRVEYYKFDEKKPYLTLYVNSQFSLNGFVDGRAIVMGFTEVPTIEQETNPTTLKCGFIDENGKTQWFKTVPGMNEFEQKVEEWQASNEEMRVLAGKDKAKKEKDEIVEEVEEEMEEELLYDEDGNLIENTDEEEEEALEEEAEEEELIEIDPTSGPIFYTDEIMNTPIGGFFVYKNVRDPKDPYSWYTDKGEWYADLDTSFLAPDDEKGFKIGNYNHGSIGPKGYLFEGQKFYNNGPLMVLPIGEKDVLIDISKCQAMSYETISDEIVVAIHDEIRPSAANAWVFRDGETYGYLDSTGEAQKLIYEAATDFVNGYALVIKNGKAIIIDESFAEIESLGDATKIVVGGDIISLEGSEGVKRYMLKAVLEDAIKKP